MKLFFGIALGAVGMWAYKSGKLNDLMGIAPEPVQQAWQPAAERIGQMRTPQIATPSAAEVSGRPSEPLPTGGA